MPGGLGAAMAPCPWPRSTATGLGDRGRNTVFLHIRSETNSERGQEDDSYDDNRMTKQKEEILRATLQRSDDQE